MSDPLAPPELDEWDIQLELKDRLPYPQILTASLISIKKALAQPDFKMSKIQALILDLYTDIPDSWMNKEFLDKLELCITEKIVDVRPSRRGKRMTVEYCVRNKIEVVGKHTQIDYFKLKNAIINLLDNLNMLIRKEKIGMTTGINLEILTLDDLPLYDEVDEFIDETEPVKTKEDEKQ